MFSIPYHGKYCGPGWSAGRMQPSVVSEVLADDEFDQTCKEHDSAYATAGDVQVADAKFMLQNFGMGFKRTLAAAAMVPQYITRGLTKPINKKKNTMTKTGNLRGAAVLQKKTLTNTNKEKRNKANSSNERISAAPVAYATQITGGTPKINASGTTFKVAHRAYLGVVTNTTDFSVLQYSTNPGLGSMFPWLHRIARRYEEYRFRKLAFEFRSVAASSTAGVIMMSFDYDAADSPPATKANQAQTIPNIENNVWMNTLLEVPCNQPYKYVRAGDLGPNLDIKTYDLGQLHVSTAYGTTTGPVVGELYVHYEIELRYPTDGPNTCAWASAVGASKPFPVGTSLTFDSDTKASPFAYRSSSTIAITQPGEYLFAVTFNGSFTTGTLGYPTLTGSSSSLLTGYWSNATTTTSATLFVVRVAAGDYINLAPIYNNANVTSISEGFIKAAVCDYDALI